MPFKQYPDDIATTIYVDSEIHLSDIDSNENTQLQYFGIQLFKYGLNANVDLFIKAYDLADNLIATSQKIDAEQFPTATDYFYGWVYFKFEPRLNMTDGTGIRFKLSLVDYTFSEASWIGAIYDWPITMGYHTNPQQLDTCPYAIDLIGAN